MFIENVMSIQESDPVWGRTFLSKDACYKYAIPAEFIQAVSCSNIRGYLFRFYLKNTQAIAPTPL